MSEIPKETTKASKLKDWAFLIYIFSWIPLGLYGLRRENHIGQGEHGYIGVIMTIASVMTLLFLLAIAVKIAINSKKIFSELFADKSIFLWGPIALIGTPIIIFIMSMLYIEPLIGVLYLADDFVNIFKNAIHEASIFLIVTFTFFISLIGGLAFLMRLYWRSIYGLTEVLTGIAIIVYRLTNQSNQNSLNMDFFIAIITAGIYLIVRGLDNMHQGWKDDVEIRALIKYVRNLWLAL